MPYSTRSRQASGAPKRETVVKTTTKRAAVGKNVKEKTNAKTKSDAKKNLEQDENAVPPTKISRTSGAKNSQLKISLTGSKLTCVKGDDSSPRKSKILSLKSPVLQDRTNINNNNIAVELRSKKTNEVLSSTSKKTVNKKSIKKSEQKNNENDTNENHTLDKTPLIKYKKYSLKNIEDMLEEDQEMEINSDKAIAIKKVTNDSKLKAKKLSNCKASELKSNKMNSNETDNKIFKKKNISMEEVENLLNEDDKINENELEVEEKSKNIKTKDTKSSINNRNKPEISTDVNTNGQNLQKECSNTEKVSTEKKKENQNNKKFFKNINPKKDIQPSVKVFKRARRQKVKLIKNNESHDVFSDEIDKESIEGEKKTLRPRATKNYCELSHLSKTSQGSNNIDDKKSVDVKISKDKNVPIYKTIRLSQESVKDKEEIYQFPDDSQDKEIKSKKRKKTTKRPIVKRVKKTVKTKLIIPQDKLKKSVKKVPRNVQFMVTEPVQEEIENIQHNNEVSNDISTIKDDTNLQPAKIIADQKLEGSKRINLMATPAVPKTINSQLKLFGPKNAITLQPTSQYKNMVNHSLIRKSMSPISKVVEEFDPGSPWRPVDTFSRIKKVVQSTPRINRPPIIREKKLPAPTNYDKSISSEDTIHISSTTDNKSNDKSKTDQNERSPRKFGTTISNTSPIQSKSIENMYNAKTLIVNEKSPIQAVSLQTSSLNNQQSPIKAVSPPSAFEECSIDNQTTEKSSIINKENTQPSPNKMKKFSSPSPFRLEKIRSSARIASNKVISRTSKSSDEIGDKKEELQAGPSSDKKPTPTNLKQSNLHDFLQLAEMPESTRISTAHGIFDDIHSTPITRKKQKKFVEELNVENAFGFDDSETMDEPSETQKASKSKIVTEKDVENSVKGKIFPKARVKSAVPSRISENNLKKTLLKSVLKKQTPKENDPKIGEETDENIVKEKEEKNEKDIKNNDEVKPQKKAVLEAVSFSDTFDVLSENGEDLESKVPEELPLFVDLEPVHFTQPPRRSYIKRKRGVDFDTDRDYSEDDDEPEHKKPKHKKKKEDKLSKEEQKRMKEWVKSINETFEEIDHFDLVVE